jgi:hypothetical protein
MTAKSEKRIQPGASQFGSPQGEIQTAYQIHTLAQILYGQIASAQPLGPSFAPLQGYGPAPYFEAAAPSWIGASGMPAWSGHGYGVPQVPMHPFMTGFGPFLR